VKEKERKDIAEQEESDRAERIKIREREDRNSSARRE